MNSIIRFLIFFFLSFLSSGTLFGALIESNIYFVWIRSEDARGEFFVKAPSYKKIEGPIKSLSGKAFKFRGENPISVYQKSATGAYETCGEINIPAGVRNCAVIFVPDWENDETAFVPKVLNLDSVPAKGGELIFCNLTSLTLRAQVRGNSAEKYLPDETRKLYSLGTTQESGSFSFKVLAAAAKAEEAKRTWRYGNSMRLVKSQCYYMIALPGKPKDDPEKPPQCELITLRKDAK